MSRLKNPIAFTANRLLDGEAVWLGPKGNWVESFELAHAIYTEAQLEMSALQAARADADNIIIEPYEIDLSCEDGEIAPVKFREKVRATGPTIRLDLGKQATHTMQAA